MTGNRNFTAAQEATRRADAIMEGIQAAYIDHAGMLDLEQLDKLDTLLYLLWDQIREAAAALERLAGDKIVVDVIREAHRRSGRDNQRAGD